jgi:endonuclease-3
MLADPPHHILAVDAGLSQVYGSPVSQPDGDPLGGLIATILSQHTSDVNSDRAYARLRARFPSWEAVLAAPCQEVEDAIRPGGLAAMKAARIQQILEAILLERDALDLDWLHGLPLPEARAALTAFHGVGPKTASCVLLFNLGMPAFPVDTHVHRLSLRIGFASPGAGPAAVQDLVESCIQPERAYPLHVNLITHGRRVCMAQRPKCSICSLRPICRMGTESAIAT